MKKVIIIIACFLLGFQLASAQQEPLFAQYNHNAFLFNPAVAGADEYHEIMFSGRSQWLDFPGGPQTYILSYQGGWKGMGFGAYLFNDRTGPTRRLGGNLAYAYHINLGKDYKLGIGVSGRYVRYEIDVDKITFQDLNDNAIFNAYDGLNKFEASAGIHFYSEQLYVSLAVPNLLETSLDFGTQADTRDPLAKYYRHFYGMAGYKFDKWKVNPEIHALVKMTQTTPIQYEGGVRLHFLEDQLNLGAVYRSPGFISINFGVVFDKMFPINFAFDFATSEFQNYSSGSLELMFGAQLPRKDREQMWLPHVPQPGQE